IYMAAGTSSVRSFIKLELPEGILETLDVLAIHPALLDAAAHGASAGVIDTLFGTALKGKPESQRTPVPFYIEEAAFLSKCTRTMWALTEFDNSRPDENIRKTTVSLFDERGDLCTKLTGLSCR